MPHSYNYDAPVSIGNVGNTQVFMTTKAFLEFCDRMSATYHLRGPLSIGPLAPEKQVKDALYNALVSSPQSQFAFPRIHRTIDLKVDIDSDDFPNYRSMVGEENHVVFKADADPTSRKLTIYSYGLNGSSNSNLTLPTPLGQPNRHSDKTPGLRKLL